MVLAGSTVSVYLQLDYKRILTSAANWRTGRAVVTRQRELVVQFIITLANYEYVFAYKLDTAAGITLETRATGIVSVVNIDPGKTSDYGNVVSNGVLAQNHQHIFAARKSTPSTSSNAC
jgi:primary-amine oxidase